MDVAISLCSEAWGLGWRPDPLLTVSQWADAHRVLSAKGASEPGRWRTSRTPYLREVMDELSPSSHIERVVLMAGAQIGKTECGNNWLGYIVHHAPGPIMLVQPTVELAKRLSKQRLAPMIEETQVLRDRIAEPRSKDSSNTMLVKEFPGGTMILTGANSAVGLRSVPVRYLFCDEIDGYPVDVEGEGDPVSLAERRTTTFARRKILLTSTPTVRDVSRIEREFFQSDQRYYNVPCPHCEHMQVLRWAQMNWTNDDPSTARYECESCHVLIEERNKTWMLERGQWIATTEGDGRTAGFHLSSLYSPLGWKSWVQIVDEFLRSRRDPPMLKTWVNTILGESWEDDEGVRIAGTTLRARAEPYSLLTVPAGGLMLTAGVDVQDNRLAIVIDAFGQGEENWTIYWGEIYGDPAQPALWTELDNLLGLPIRHESGQDLYVQAVAIDSGGHHTQAVYQFCRARRAKHVIAIKGAPIPSPIGKPNMQDISWRGTVIKQGAQLWPVGSDAIKGVIYSRLKISDAGPGYAHFSVDLPQEFYEQLTSEKLITKYVRGFPKREWVKKDSTRNEALDCKVYAYAAAIYAGMGRMNWQALKESLYPPNEAIVDHAQTIESDSPNKGVIPRRQNWISPRKNWFR